MNNTNHNDVNTPSDDHAQIPFLFFPFLIIVVPRVFFVAMKTQINKISNFSKILMFSQTVGMRQFWCH